MIAKTVVKATVNVVIAFNPSIPISSSHHIEYQLLFEKRQTALNQQPPKGPILAISAVQSTGLKDELAAKITMSESKQRQ